MTLKFHKIPAVVMLQVQAEFHQTKCSNSRVIMVTVREKKKTGKNRKKLSNDAVKLYCRRYRGK